MVLAEGSFVSHYGFGEMAVGGAVGVIQTSDRAVLDKAMFYLGEKVVIPDDENASYLIFGVRGKGKIKFNYADQQTTFDKDNKPATIHDEAVLTLSGFNQSKTGEIDGSWVVVRIPKEAGTRGFNLVINDTDGSVTGAGSSQLAELEATPAPNSFELRSTTAFQRDIRGWAGDGVRVKEVTNQDEMNGLWSHLGRTDSAPSLSVGGAMVLAVPTEYGNSITGLHSKDIVNNTKGGNGKILEVIQDTNSQALSKGEPGVPSSVVAVKPLTSADAQGAVLIVPVDNTVVGIGYEAHIV